MQSNRCTTSDTWLAPDCSLTLMFVSYKYCTGRPGIKGPQQPGPSLWRWASYNMGIKPLKGAKNRNEQKPSNLCCCADEEFALIRFTSIYSNTNVRNDVCFVALDISNLSTIKNLYIYIIIKMSRWVCLIGVPQTAKPVGLSDREMALWSCAWLLYLTLIKTSRNSNSATQVSEADNKQSRFLKQFKKKQHTF